MSAFIVSDRVISIVVDAIMSSERNDVWTDGLRDQQTALGQELYLLNACAVADRYRDPSPECCHAIEYEYHDPFPHVPMGSAGPNAKKVAAQRLMSVQSYLYQCSEGDIDRTPLFERAQLAQYRIAFDIAIGTPEYNEAEWS